MNKNSFRPFILAIAIISSGTSAFASSDKQTAESIVIGKFGAMDGSALLKTLIEKAKSMRSYWYESTLTTYSKKKGVTERGRFYFKTPNLMRFEALAAGRRTGSVVVRQPDGKIKAKAGGFMGGVTVSLAPTSKLLKTSNGYSVVESDLASLLEGVSKVTAGEKLLATPKPCAYPGLPPVYILELVGNDNRVHQRLAVDSDSKMPIEWLIFQQDELNSLVHVEKLISNADITDSMFFLGKETTLACAETKTIGSAAVMSESLRRKLETFDNNVPLNAEIILDVRATIEQVKLECDQLNRDFSSSQANVRVASNGNASSDFAQGNSTDPNLGKSKDAVLLIRAASIEAMSTALRSAAPAIRSFDATAGKDIGSDVLADQWQKSLDRIDESIANLYGNLDKSAPDSKSVCDEAGKITLEVAKLQTVLKWISDQSKTN